MVGILWICLCTLMHLSDLCLFSSTLQSFFHFCSVLFFVHTHTWEILVSNSSNPPSQLKKKLVMHEAAARACVNDAEIQINNANLGENSPSCQLSQPQLHTQRRPSWLPHLLPNHCHNFWILVWGYDPLDPPLGLKTITKMEGGVRKWHCIFI